MYYIVAEYELPILASSESRKLIIIANKKNFTYMYDYHFLDVEQERIIERDFLRDFMKNGFSTRAEATNSIGMKKVIEDFVDMIFNDEFVEMSEKELLQKYDTLITKDNIS